MTPARELELERRWRSDYLAALREAGAGREANRCQAAHMMACADSVLEGVPRTRAAIHAAAIDAMLATYC